MAETPNELEPFQKVREAFLTRYRRDGVQDTDMLLRQEPALETLAASARGRPRAQALLELATSRRLRREFGDAIGLYQEVASLARAEGYSDLLFDAEIATARAYAYGTHDHAAAAAALDRAQLAAGPQAGQTPKQRHDLASYEAQLLDNRNELEAALVKALAARRLAASIPQDRAANRFHAEYDYAGILRNFAERSDYVRVIDARTFDDGPGYDGWEASRRAVAASRAAYLEAARISDEAGWTALGQQMRESGRWLDMRRTLIDARARSDRMADSCLFRPRRSQDVIVNRSFEAGASTMTGQAALAGMVDAVAGDAAAIDRGPDPRTDFLYGLSRDMKGDRDGALALFERAASNLQREKAGLFDARRRGTVLEDRGEIPRNLAMRLLAMDRLPAAFDAFEQIRARGLGEVRAALAQTGEAEDRAWLARLLQTEAMLSSSQANIARRVIAGMTDGLDADLDEVERLEELRRGLFAEPGAKARIDRLGGVSPELARLSDLERVARASRTSVVMYWVVHPNIVVWHVGPEPGSTWARTIFLPEPVLERKLEELRRALDRRTGSEQFDATAARELYLYLVAAITEPRDLDGAARVVTPPQRPPGLQTERVLFVPQGPLIALPFEALIDPLTDKYLVERWETSYAPNATEAVRILERRAAADRAQAKARKWQVTPVVAPELRGSAEISRIKAVLGEDRVAPVGNGRLTRQALLDTMAQADILHVNAHGFFETEGDPLLSNLRDVVSGERVTKFTAAEFVAVPVRAPDPRRLVVLSSCEGGVVGRRISNEIYGFTWALLVSGVPNVVVARWKLDASENPEWIGRFYAALETGRSPAGAAAAAMRAMRDRPPHLWAAMQVLGE